jgi:hypothetical protein
VKVPLANASRRWYVCFDNGGHLPVTPPDSSFKKNRNTMKTQRHDAMVMNPHAPVKEQMRNLSISNHVPNPLLGTVFTLAETRSLVNDFVNTWQHLQQQTTGGARHLCRLPGESQNIAFRVAPTQLDLLMNKAKNIAFMLCMNRNAAVAGSDTVSMAIAGLTDDGRVVSGMTIEKWPGSLNNHEVTSLPMGLAQKAARAIGRYLPAALAQSEQAREMVAAFVANWTKLINIASGDGETTVANLRLGNHPLMFVAPAAEVAALRNSPGVEAIIGLYGFRNGHIAPFFVGVDGEGAPVTNLYFLQNVAYTVDTAHDMVDDVLDAAAL